MGYRWTMQIQAPPEAVFDALADLPSHGSWANPSAKLKVHEVSGGAPAVGSKYRSEQMFLRTPGNAELEITAFDRPRRFAFSVLQHLEGKPDARYRQSFTLTPEAGGTRLERVTDGEFGGAVKAFLLTPAVKADGKKALNNLKRKLETG